MEEGAPATLPMTEGYLVGHRQLPGDFAIVRNVGSLQAQTAFIEAGLRAHFAREMHDRENLDSKGRLLFTDFEQSDRYYTYRPDGEFKILYERVEAPDHRPPSVEVVLGRTLHGTFNLPPEMLWILELEETARLDFGGRCVSHQLLCVKKRAQTEQATQPVWKDIKEVEVTLHYLQYRCHGGRRDPPIDITAKARFRSSKVASSEFLPPFCPQPTTASATTKPRSKHFIMES